jgi:hypothetical protein
MAQENGREEASDWYSFTGLCSGGTGQSVSGGVPLRKGDGEEAQMGVRSGSSFFDGKLELGLGFGERKGSLGMKRDVAMDGEERRVFRADSRERNYLFVLFPVRDGILTLNPLNY